MDGWMDGQTDGWTDGWMDGWTDGWMAGSIGRHIDLYRRRRQLEMLDRRERDADKSITIRLFSEHQKR